MRHPSRTLAALFASSFVLQCQEPTAVPPDVIARALERGVPIHDEGVDPRHGPLGVWAAGRDYKCGFADGAFVMIPYLGEAAPHNVPWQWRTTSVQLGERELLGGEPARDAHGDWRFTRTRGAVDEVWDVLPHGVEQSFVVAAPAGRATGELRIRGQLSTAMVAAPRPAAVAPLRFVDAATGYELDYGTATAFDANGRSTPVPASYDGDAITLHVPAAFVAGATWPLRIDPLLQPYGIASGSSVSFQDLDADAIPGSQPGHRVGMVWSRAASAADSDLHVFRADHDFSAGALFASELSTTVSSREGSLAGSWIDHTMVVAWSRRANGTTWCHVESFAADAASGTLANPSPLAFGTSTNEWRPRVVAAKASALSPAHAFVVRLREIGGATELWGTLYGTSSQTAYGSTQIAAPSVYVGDIAEPWVAKNILGDYEAWLVAYQFWHHTNSRWEVAVKRVAYTGQLDAQALTMHVGVLSRHCMRPRIDGCGTRYLVAFATAPTAQYPGQLTSYGGTSIETQRIDWTHAGGPSQPWPRQVVATAAGRSLHPDGIACSTRNRSHWLLGVRHGGSAEVKLLGYRGDVVAAEPLPGPAGQGTHVAQAAVVAYEPENDVFPVLHAYSTSLSGNVTHTCTGSTRAPVPGPLPMPYGTSCGLQAPNTTGDFRVGTDRNWIGVSGLAAGDWLVAGLSLAPASHPFANVGIGGGCTIRVDLAPPHWIGTVALFASATGYASLQLPLPENLPSFDLYVQFVAAAPAPGELRATRGVHVTVR